MRRTLMIITVALVLCLCGRSEVPQISDIPTEPSQSESLPIIDSEEISQETDAPQSSVGSRVEWCACFVSWCADQCGYIETGVCPKYAGCVNGVAWFKEHNQWVDGSETPSPGMIIFYDWDSPNGSSGPQDGLSDHTGIVEKVENGIIYTVEGNSGDSCRENHYPVGYYEILGYGILNP